MVGLASQARGQIQPETQQQFDAEQVGFEIHLAQLPAFNDGNIKGHQAVVIIADTRRLGAQPLQVESTGVHGAATGFIARHGFVVIHVTGQWRIFDVTVSRHESEHFPGPLGIGADTRICNRVANQALEVGIALFSGIIKTGFCHTLVSGNPDHPARFGRCATVHGLLFHHQHRATQFMGDHRAGHSGGTATGHQPVDLFQAALLPVHKRSRTPMILLSA